MSVGSTGSTSNSNSSSAAGSQNPLQQLSSNFNDFMSMLLTQLQNQDPTSPMDTQSFTTELVQFTGVEQQVATNSSLSQLIQLTQSNQVLQSASVVGHAAVVQSNQLTVQSSQAAMAFTTQAAEPVQITVTDGSGNTLYSQTVNATAGDNSWSWNGQTNNGEQLPDGAYNVTVTTGTAKNPVPFFVEGTITGMQENSGSVLLQLGSLTVPMTSLTAMLN